MFKSITLLSKVVSYCAHSVANRSVVNSKRFVSARATMAGFFNLNGDVKIPAIGYGTWQVSCR